MRSAPSSSERSAAILRRFFRWPGLGAADARGYNEISDLPSHWYADLSRGDAIHHNARLRGAPSDAPGGIVDFDADVAHRALEIMFCSDGDLHGSHPRGAGAFPRVLGRYVREQKALSLESAIHKMTGLPAQQLGLKDRGRIAPGYVADLVLFDPATVIDESTIEQPEAPPVGIPVVMVAGDWVIEDGHVSGKHPGQVLRPSRTRD